MGELEFQQRWEFRRNEDNDLDSSCGDSKSSNGPLLKKHKLVSSLISVGYDETSRLKQQDNDNPGTGGPINIGKAKKRKTRNISSNLQNSKMKRDSPEEVDLWKGETSANDPAPLDDLKNFMDSLLKDLKVTRVNLLKWMMEEMQKLVADDATPEPKRRKRGHREEKVQLQQTEKSMKVQDQYEKPTRRACGSSIRITQRKVSKSNTIRTFRKQSLRNRLATFRRISNCRCSFKRRRILTGSIRRTSDMA